MCMCMVHIHMCMCMHMCMTARVHVRCTDILYVGVGACACVATRPDTRARARAGARTAQPEPRTFGLAAHLSARLRAGAGRAGSRLSLVARVAGQKARGFLISLVVVPTARAAIFSNSQQYTSHDLTHPELPCLVHTFHRCRNVLATKRPTRCSTKMLANLSLGSPTRSG
jgi:hypothetical protein